MEGLLGVCFRRFGGTLDTHLKIIVNFEIFWTSILYTRVVHFSSMGMVRLCLSSDTYDNWPKPHSLCGCHPMLTTSQRQRWSTSLSSRRTGRHSNIFELSPRRAPSWYYYILWVLHNGRSMREKQKTNWHKVLMRQILPGPTWHQSYRGISCEPSYEPGRLLP